MNDYVGTIRLFAGPYAPANWAFCNGQSLSTTQYPKLFALIAYTYGGSGTSFSVPNFANSIALGAGPAATGTNYVVGDDGGSTMTILNGGNLPAHTHMVSGTLSMPKNADSSSTSDPESSYPGPAPLSAYSVTPLPNSYMAPPDIDLSLVSPGGQQNQPVSNLMPSVPINYIIALDPDPQD